MEPPSRPISLDSFICQGISELHADGEMNDLTVTIGDTEFQCHRVLLASVSKFFRAQFRHEPNSDHVTLDSGCVSPESFSLLLRMLYEKVDGIEDSDTAQDLLLSARFLQADCIQEHCEKFLVKNMEPNTCLDRWQFADNYELKSLGEEARKMATTRFKEVSKSKTFCNLPLHYLLIVLSSADLVINKEDELFGAILIWVYHEIKNRERHLPVLLPFLNFVNLSDSFIQSLSQDSLRFSCIQGYLNDGTTYKMETYRNLNSVAKRAVIARQDRRVPSADVEKVVVAVGGTADEQRAARELKAIALESGQPAGGAEHLSPLPADPGSGFATCVWRNELYVSGGSEHPTFFAVYNAGTNEWKQLPHLPSSRQRHGMAAVGSNIFVLGGKDTFQKTTSLLAEKVDVAVEKPEVVKTMLCSSVFAFSTCTRKWSTFAPKTKPRTDVTAAVIGHRIYVFGGNDAKNQPTSLVECVDTLTETVYQAGHLPSPTSGAHALGNGSVIFVVLPEGNIFRMKETFTLPNTGKSNLSQVSAAAGSSASNEVEPNITDKGTPSTDTDNNLQDTPASTSKDGSHPAVSFQMVADVKRRHFGTCLHGGEILVCGGQKEEGGKVRKLSDVIGVSVHDGTLTTKTLEVGDLSSCAMEVLNMPKLADNVEFKFTFRPDQLTEDDDTYSHDVRISMFDWYLTVCKEENNLQVYLFKRETKTAGKWKVDARCTFWLLPVKPAASVKFKERTYTFSDSEGTGYGTPSFISIEKLTDPGKGYITPEGEVTIHVSVTITGRSRLETA